MTQLNIYIYIYIRNRKLKTKILFFVPFSPTKIIIIRIKTIPHMKKKIIIIINKIKRPEITSISIWLEEAWNGRQPKQIRQIEEATQKLLLLLLLPLRYLRNFYWFLFNLSLYIIKSRLVIWLSLNKIKQNKHCRLLLLYSKYSFSKVGIICFLGFQSQVLKPYIT